MFVLVHFVGTGQPRGQFTYACSFRDAQVGDVVVVPFGKNNTLRLGSILEINPKHAFKRFATKWVAAHIDHRAHDMRMAMGMPDID